MTVRFVSVAEQEYVEAIDHYNKEKPGLGYEFAAEVDAAVGRILEYPLAWPTISERVRRCRTDRFPYGLLYCASGEEILVVAVMHLHRNPVSWQKRIGEDSDSRGV